jgi:hypothetical protein
MTDTLPAQYARAALAGRRLLVGSATVLFAGLVVGVFCYMSCSCDLELYHWYGRTARAESLTGLYRTCDVEYPPLAIGLMVLTEEIAARSPNPTLLSGFGAYQHGSADFLRFKVVYRLAMVVCAFVTWWVVIVLLGRHFAHESPGEWAERLLCFALCVWLLGYVLLDRLDMGLICLSMLALLLLLSRKHYVWSLAVLAAAIDFKFVPAALVPVWLLATLPRSTLTGWPCVAGLQRLSAGCFVRAAVLGGFVAAFMLPLWLFVGSGCLKYLTFHAHRGIELQSNYAAVLTLLKHLGYPVRTCRGWGSAVLECSAAPVLTHLASMLVGLSVLAGALVLFMTLARRSARALEPGEKPAAPLLLGHLLWALLVFVLCNKTFSSQYLVWLVPLVAVVPLSGVRRRLFQLGFLGVSYLSMLIFPRCFADVVGTYPSAADHSLSTGATSFGTGLLLARLLLLVFLAAILALALFRRMQGSRTPPPLLRGCGE